MHRSPWLFFGVQIAFFVFPSVIHSSHSADFKVLIWKSGPAKVGETITFSAEVVLRPEARTKRNTRENLTYEFFWKVSSRPWVKHQKTTQRWDSFPCQWTQAGDKTILVYVRILDDNNGPDSRHGHRFSTAYSSYYARNETKVIVSETEVFHPNLVIKTSTGSKLPSDSKANLLPKNSPIEFELKFNDPSIVASVSSDWKFGHFLVTKWPNTTIYHTFHKEGKYGLWVTVRVTTTTHRKKSCSPIHKTLFIKAPVFLEVQRKHLEPEKKTWRFNISCNGSLPVSFHWCISKQCDLPPEEMCSPTMEYNSSCSLVVNHTFTNPGNYCVNVGVKNDVSGTNTSFMIQIPGDKPVPKFRSGKSSATGLIVTLLIACVLLLVVLIAVRKWNSSKRVKPAEKADFEFRDFDALSVSSGEPSLNRICFTGCGVWGSQKTAENAPLWRESRMYSL